MRSLRSWLCTAVAVALVLGVAMAGGARVRAQAAEALPVDIHSGTCDNPTAEPAYDAGLAEPVQETGETEAEDVVDGEDDEAVEDDVAGVDVGVLGDDRVLNQDDEGYLAQDINADGVNEVGIDQDGNGTLDEGEVLGVDANNDGALDETEFAAAAEGADEAAVEEEAQALVDETVYKADTELEDVNPEDLFAQPHVIIVHQSEEAYTTYLACGEIKPLVEENLIVVPLRPVGEESDFFGVSLITEDGSENAAYIWRGLQQPAQAAETPAPPPPTATPEPTATPAPPTPTPPPPTPTPTPVPTDTPVPTAVIVETEVVTEEVVVTEVVRETEVVPAPTATAEAQG